MMGKQPSSRPASQEAALSRRGFLAVATRSLLWLSGVLGAWGIVRFLGLQTEPAPQTEFDLGPASQFPAGTRVVVANGQALLVHDQAGLRAVSLVCPHLGCTVEEKPDGFTCPCHGSRFTPDGALRRGPAAEGLRALRLEETAEGELIVRTGE